MTKTTIFHQDLDPATANRLRKAAVLARVANNLGYCPTDIVDETVRERVLTETRWAGATLACWQMVVIILESQEV